MNELYLSTADKKEGGNKEMLVKMLRSQGIKITKQRTLIIDIILEQEIHSCKDIYQQASKVDSKIGVATVYRMVKTLEKIGAINRKISVTL